jgi:hypothetical protein
MELIFCNSGGRPGSGSFSMSDFAKAKPQSRPGTRYDPVWPKTTSGRQRGSSYLTPVVSVKNRRSRGSFGPDHIFIRIAVVRCTDLDYLKLFRI